jgi:hypothetical protein
MCVCVCVCVCEWVSEIERPREREISFCWIASCSCSEVCGRNGPSEHTSSPRDIERLHTCMYKSISWCTSSGAVPSAGAPQSQRQCNLILSDIICSKRLRRRSKRRSTQYTCQPLENVVTQTTITRRRRGHETRDGVSVLLYLSLVLSPSLSLFLSPLFFWNSWHHRSVVMCPVCLSVSHSLTHSLYIYIYIYTYILSLSPSLSFSVSLSLTHSLTLPFSLSLFLYFSRWLPPSLTPSLWLRDDEGEIIMYY